MSLSIKLFGPIQVLVENRPVQPPRSRKALWLLALLALREKALVEREWLASMLWPDSDRTQGLANLRTALSELRTTLGPEGGRLISPNRHTIQINLDAAVVDVIEFDRCIGSGKRSDLERAVAIYHGDLLEGSNEEWVVQERGTREQDCLRALQTLGETSLAGGDTNAAIGWFQRAINLNPWWDAPHRGLMEAHAKAGDLNEALLVYRNFEERLRSESAGMPDERTSALYSQLRAKVRGQRPGTAKAAGEFPAVSGYVPQPITELVGREDERTELLVLLRRSRLITLTGLGGIGKTRLAIAVASEVSDEFSDGRWFVSLSAISDGELVPRQMCSVLNITERTGRSWLELATEHLRTKHALLILDNCEHVLETCASISRHLLQECAGVRILTTSREPLGILGESVWTVPTLPVPDPAHMPQASATLQRVMMGYDGVQLFLDRARDSDRTFSLNASNALAIAEICSSLEGVPLAMELAAAHVHSFGISQIQTRLGDRLGTVTSSTRAAEPRHLTLRTTLDWSYDLLTEAEQRLLRRLAVFVGGWTLESAEQVCSRDDDERETVAATLASLVAKSLVILQVGAGESQDRYRMLETVRRYSEEKLVNSEEAEVTHRAHRRWALSISERTNAAIQGEGQANWLRYLSVEHGNLLKAMVGFESAPSEGLDCLRMASGLLRFWLIRGPLQEGRERLQKALAHEGGLGETPERGIALNCAGALAYHDYDYAVARPLFLESLEMLTRFGDHAGMVSPSNNLGNVLLAEGNYEGALEAFEKSIELALQTNQRPGYALALINLGLLLVTHLGDARRARERYEEALSVYRELGDPRGIAIALEGVGFAATNLGDYEAARISHEECLGIRIELGDQRAMWSIFFLGVVAYSRADFLTAQGHWARSLSLFKEADHKHGIAATSKFFCLTDLFLGNLDSAARHGDEALSAYRELGIRRNILETLIGLGDVAVDQGMLNRARQLIVEALILSRDIGARRNAWQCLDGFAGLLSAEGDDSTAVRLWASTHAQRERTGERLPVPIEVRCERNRDLARTRLGDDVFHSSWAEGLNLSLDDAVNLALASVAPVSNQTSLA